MTQNNKKESTMTKDQINAAWQKAIPTIDLDPHKYRKDRQGNTIGYDDYDQSNVYGWVIDSNLQPVHRREKETA